MTARQRDPKFYCELKKLNEDLIEYLKLSHDKSPYFDFSPSVKDYMKQLAELEKQFPEKQNGFFSKPDIPNPAPTLFSAPLQTNSSPFVFGSIPNSQPTSSIQTPIFSTSLSTSTAPAPSPFFSFPKPPTMDDSAPKFGGFMTPAAPAVTAAPALPATSTVAGNGAPEQADGDGEEEEHQPPVAKIDKYEEPDSTYSVRCKLYEKVPKSPGSSEYAINTLGIGVMYLKSIPDTSNLQMIIRQDPDLLRVLLNEVVTPNIPIKLLSKAVQIVFPVTGGGTKIYIMKTKDDNEAKKTHETLMSIKK